MKPLLRKTITIWNIVLKTVIVFLTAILFVIVGYNVVRRYVFNNSVAWADELSRFLFLWINFLAITSVFKGKELVSLDILTKKFQNKYLRQMFSSVELLVVFAVLLTIFVYSIQFVSIMGHVSATLALPMRLIYIALPISTGIMLINCLFVIINQIKKMGK